MAIIPRRPSRPFPRRGPRNLSPISHRSWIQAGTNLIDRPLAASTGRFSSKVQAQKSFVSLRLCVVTFAEPRGDHIGGYVTIRVATLCIGDDLPIGRLGRITFARRSIIRPSQSAYSLEIAPRREAIAAPTGPVPRPKRWNARRYRPAVFFSSCSSRPFNRKGSALTCG
jgi:hypothetical protein